MELWERVRRLRAAAVLAEDVNDLYLSRLLPGEPVWVACDLLAAGVDGPAVVALACEPPTELGLKEGEPMVRRLLEEVGGEPMSFQEAEWVTARDVAAQIDRGALEPEDGAHLLYGLRYAFEDPAEEGTLSGVLDAWEETPPMHRDAGRFAHQVRAVAAGILRRSGPVGRGAAEEGGQEGAEGQGSA